MDHEKNRKPVSQGRENIDSQIREKKILIHASGKEKTPIHASRKKYKGPSRHMLTNTAKLNFPVSFIKLSE